MTIFKTFKTSLRAAAAIAAVVGFTGSAQAGSILLTGHDVLLHGGQSGYDAVILDYLRDGDAKAGYTISVVGSGVGSVGASNNQFGGGSNFAGAASGSSIANVGTLFGYGAVTYYKTGTSADWATILSADALIIMGHTSCSGCDLSNAGSTEVNSNSAAIAAAFNAGMDIWGNTGATLGTYYDFLPPAVATSASSISATSGFVATGAGTGIGIVSTMINGFQTHNRFSGFSGSFTIFEERPLTGSTETITIGLQGGTITNGGITVPEPASLALFGLGLAGLGFMRRRRAA